MSIKMIMMMYLPIFLILFFLGMYMPSLTRKEIFFGVRIPEDKINSEAIINFKKQYRKTYSLICGSLLILLMVVTVYSENELVFVVSVFIYIFVETIVYYITHKKVRLYKKQNNWQNGKKEVVMVDTSFRSEKNGKMLASSLLFLIPIAIIIFNIVIGYKTYPNLPEQVPIHWNIQGQVDDWMQKSYKVIYMMPFIQMFILIVMFICYKVIGLSKVQISASNPEVSREQNKRFRYIWSQYIIFSTVVLMLIFTFGNLTILNIIKLTGAKMLMVAIIPAILITIGAIVISVITGQGGSRLKIRKNNKNQVYMDRNDDKYWKAGMFYVNKNDPAVIIEKRYGIGWTINFGNPKGVIVFSLFILIVILVPILSSLFFK